MFLYQWCFYSWILLVIYTGCEAPSGEPGKELKLIVYHYKQPCMGEDIQLCFRVSREGGEPEFFYDKIEGFNYSWGYNYEINVVKNAVSSPKSDASSFAYKLKKVLKKTKVPVNETFVIHLLVDGRSAISNNNGTCTLNGEIKIYTKDFSCAELSKSSSAVFRHEGEGISLVKINNKD